MGRWFKQHYMGALALFVALGGTGYAAARIDTNDIASNAIVSRHVDKNALTGKDIKKIKGADIDEASLNATRVVARIHVTPNLAIGTSATAFPIAGGWTQQANEFDQFAGQITVLFPAGCGVPQFGFRSATVEILRPDGTVAAIAPVLANLGGEQQVSSPISGVGDDAALEPGANTPRTLSGRATAICDAGSTAFPVLQDVNLTVIGNR